MDLKKSLEQLQISAHNFTMSLPGEDSRLFNELGIHYWEIQAASHFTGRIAEMAKRKLDQIKRNEEYQKELKNGTPNNDPKIKK